MVTLEAAAKVAAMGEREEWVCDQGEWMYLKVGEQMNN